MWKTADSRRCGRGLGNSLFRISRSQGAVTVIVEPGLVDFFTKVFHVPSLAKGC